jgi:DNA-binding NtrC family response regulator
LLRSLLTMKILIIDDEVLVTDLFARAVRKQGHEAIVATNYDEVLVVVQRERPDAIFLDVVMPGLNGLDVLREVRRRSPALPVVIVTGHASSREIEEARKLGVLDVLKKPYVLNALTPTLERLQADQGNPKRSG